MTFPPIPASVEALGLDPNPLGPLRELITAHIAEGRYPAAQMPVARHGKLGLVWTLGAAHWVAAVLIEALTKTDYRAFIREHIAEPLGLGDELFVGLPDRAHARAVDMHEPAQDGARQVRRSEESSAEARRAGSPGGGGYATARAMAAFYQMLLQGGQLGGARLLSPRTIAYVIRNYTGDRVDAYLGMAMQRGLGPHPRGTTETIRGLGSPATPRTFGHGGARPPHCRA